MVGKQCAIISTDLKKTANAKIIKHPFFSIKLDESTDISSKSLLMVFCRLPDIEARKMVILPTLSTSW